MLLYLKRSSIFKKLGTHIFFHKLYRFIIHHTKLPHWGLGVTNLKTNYKSSQLYNVSTRMTWTQQFHVWCFPVGKPPRPQRESSWLATVARLPRVTSPTSSSCWVGVALMTSYACRSRRRGWLSVGVVSLSTPICACAVLGTKWWGKFL